MALDNSTVEPRSISRRTIIKGAAWSAPVMIAAVAVPAAVASVRPTSVTPASSAFVSAQTSVTYSLSPAPANGTILTLALAGAGYSFANGLTSTSATVNSSGQFTVAINAGPGSGTLSVSAPTWTALTVPLSFTAPTLLTRSPSTALSSGSNSVTFTLNTAFSGSVVLSVPTAGNQNRQFGFNSARTLLSTTVVFTNGVGSTTVYSPSAANSSQTLTATTATPVLFSVTNSLTH